MGELGTATSLTFEKPKENPLGLYANSFEDDLSDEEDEDESGVV